MSNSSIESFLNGKVVVIKNINSSVSTPLFCSSCLLPMKNLIEDSESFRKHGVCFSCDGRFTNFPGIDWKNAHPRNIAPDMWDDYIKERRMLSRTIFNFK